MRLSQIPKLSQVAGRPLPSGSNREHLGSEVELWQVAGRRRSSCSRREVSSALLLTWFPPLLTKVIKAAVDITQLQGTQYRGGGWQTIVDRLQENDVPPDGYVPWKCFNELTEGSAGAFVLVK